MVLKTFVTKLLQVLLMSNYYPEEQDGLPQCLCFDSCNTYTSGTEYQTEGFFGKRWVNRGLCWSCWREECDINGVPSNTYTDKETGEVWQVRKPVDKKCRKTPNDTSGYDSHENQKSSNQFYQRRGGWLF